MQGGRRQAGVVEIEWQMNRDDRPHYSLSTVVRAYLIEREIARGTRRLYIEGSTPHPIAGSFVSERVCELTDKRETALVWLIERLSRWLMPRTNYVGHVLRDKALRWRRA